MSLGYENIVATHISDERPRPSILHNFSVYISLYSSKSTKEDRRSNH